MKLRYLLFLFLSFSCLQTLRAQNGAVEFIENRGQWPGNFAWKATIPGSRIFLAKNAFTFLLSGQQNDERMDDYHHGRLQEQPKLDYHAYRVSFEGANTAPEIRGAKAQQHYYNYFLGNNPEHWKGNIHPCLALDYAQLYHHIDMHVASERGHVKYDFMVQPGGDAGQIRMRFEGALGLSLKNSALVIKTSVGEVTELRPYAYQYGAEGKKEIACRYRLNGNVVSFDFPDGFDEKSLLVIDPTIVFATFTGSTADNWGFTATYDDQGDFYAGGLVNDNGYPVTLGAFQTTFAGGHNGLSDSAHGNDYASDIGISKFNPAGTALIYATYIGGSDNETPHSLIVDGAGNLVIAGRSYSSDYPTTAGAFDQTKNPMADIVITKLNPSGSALVGSTYVGGNDDDGVNYNPLEPIAGNLKYNYGDDARSEVLVDKAGNVYVTASSSSTDFPVTSGAFQATSGGQQDAVVMKLDATLSNMLYATYLGGSGDDAGYVMALDTQQAHLYVGGGTMSSNFPTAGVGAWNPSYIGGYSDGYIAKFLNSGTYPLQKITYIGTSNRDQVYGLQTDLENSVYAMGQSIGGLFPVTGGVYSNPNSCQFVVKLDSNLSTNTYSTVFGDGDPGHTNISPVAFLVDTCQNVYISGWGGNLGFTGFPATIGGTTNLPISTPAVPGQQTTTDGADFYFIVLSKNAINLLYSTFYGRFSTVPGYGEHVDGGTSRFDRSGVVYQAICGNCGGPSSPPLPTSPPNVFSPTDQSFNCNLLALKIAFQLGAVKAHANVSPDAKGCPPFTVQFQNTSTNATSYEWVYGDGSPSDTATAPAHTFLNPGVYTTMFIAVNPNACKVRDTAFLTITVDTNAVNAAFTATVTDSCGPYVATIVNNSQLSNTPGAAGITTYAWNFGDGNTTTGASPGTHTYADTGYYTITLTMTDTTACNSPDTATQTIHISSFRVTAGLLAPDSLCIESAVPFFNASANGSSYLWDFGDGSPTDTAASPVHQYAQSGIYTVTLVVTNPGACNFSDTLYKTIKIKAKPVADFGFSPTVPVPNLPVTFTNLSQHADSYIWSFGDGGGSVEENPVHQYRHTGIYTVCLEARTKEGCSDTVCKQVPADVLPGADLPTAFSPNGDGANDILYVRGGAIEAMNLKIFNRWGQKVFESSDLKVGWDGTFNNKPQEMDAYGFVLNVTFIDGTSFQKKGNVTLLR